MRNEIVWKCISGVAAIIALVAITVNVNKSRSEAVVPTERTTVSVEK